MIRYTPKQRDLMRLWQHNELCRINLLEGSVSSGKTWISLVLWAFWVKTMPQDGLYMMCAKSLTTLKRNCLLLLQDQVGESNFKFSLAAKEGFLFGRRVLLEGANDARSESKIRGLTLQGAYCDELTQFPEDFFAMLLSRLRMPGAKLFATTNPDSPMHWLKTNYIDRADELDFLDVKFTIDDNTELDPDYVENIKREYVGVFYERFILGNWILAEGRVYPMFDNVVQTIEREYEQYYVSMDYGIQNPTAMTYSEWAGWKEKERKTVDISPKSATIKEKMADGGGAALTTIGKINIEKYKCITPDITTDEVIITDERIAHIRERHPGDYELVRPFLQEALAEPDYILNDKKKYGYRL